MRRMECKVKKKGLITQRAIVYLGMKQKGTIYSTQEVGKD